MAHLGMFYPFYRDCLAQGLKGRCDYLDGIIIAQGCLHIRQAFPSWRIHLPVDFSYYLGGIARNEGVVKRIEKELDIKALEPKYDTQIAGARGGALFA